MYKVNVCSMMSGIISADNVADESVPGQAADSLTVRSTTSAVDSGLDEAVTAPSGNMGTVATVTGSVHIANHNHDFTADSAIISTTVTAVPTTDTRLAQHCP